MMYQPTNFVQWRHNLADDVTDLTSLRMTPSAMILRLEPPLRIGVAYLSSTSLSYSSSMATTRQWWNLLTSSVINSEFSMISNSRKLTGKQKNTDGWLHRRRGWNSYFDTSSCFADLPYFSLWIFVIFHKIQKN